MEGEIIRLYHDPKGKNYTLRVYAKDKNYIDYDLRFSDLSVVLTEESTSLYKNEETGETWIDYNSKVLGKSGELQRQTKVDGLKDEELKHL